MRSAAIMNYSETPTAGYAVQGLSSALAFKASSSSGFFSLISSLIPACADAACIKAKQHAVRVSMQSANWRKEAGR